MGAEWRIMIGSESRKKQREREAQAPIGSKRIGGKSQAV
jgi:hypothetical protein